MVSFEAEYKKLNKAQKEAVNEVAGPVLVVAGPGTGKTQLLSMRVANILQKTDADPTNILCLTFTNKAATNMRERLQKLVGEEANKVTVKTFHAFATVLMSGNPDYFWSGARLSTAPDAVQLEIVQNILGILPLANPLAVRFAGQFTGTNEILKALKLAKEAGLTPDKLKAIIEANLAYIEILEPWLVDFLDGPLSFKTIKLMGRRINQMPEQTIDASVTPLLSLTTVIKESFALAATSDEGTNKTKQTGKWKARWLQNQSGAKGMFSEKRRNAWWLAFSDVYHKYREQLHLRGYYDYSDMLLEVIVQMEQNPELLSSVQERYQYVLIDEFQDSNAAQLRLAHLIANSAASEGAPNLMAVGDDDQSIFGFNGAELNNMLFFERNYPKYKLIVLEENYRSSQAVLNTSQKIIEQADDRLVNRMPGLSKKLAAVNQPKSKGEIKHYLYQTREHQLSQIARELKARRGNTKDSIAVLARSHDSLKTLSSILLNLGAPIRYEQQNNILEHEAVKQIILIAELVLAISIGDKASVNEKIAKLVRHPAWQFGPKDLWHLATSNLSKPDWLNSLLNSTKPQETQLAKWLNWLANESTYQPLPVIFDNIIGLRTSQYMTSPLRHYYLKISDTNNDYLTTLSAVSLLRQMVLEFGTLPSPNLDDFVRFVSVNIKNARGITDESLFATQKQPIELYTVHKAKGLEFDQIFIIDAVEGNWQPRIPSRIPPANLPLQAPGEQDDDYIRLLFVAASRAKHTVIFTSYQSDSVGNKILPSPFISNAVASQPVKLPPDLKTYQVLEENVRWPRLKGGSEKAILKDRLSNYRLSATHMLNFLDVVNCGPQYFFERHILRLPEAASTEQSFGNAIHSALQLAQKLVNQSVFNLKDVFDGFEKSLQLENLPLSDYQRYVVYGRERLAKLFNEFNFKLAEGGLTEQPFHDIQIKKAVLNGFIDHIGITENSLLITDYKTGQPIRSFLTKDRTKVIKAWRHRSQLVFYTLLLQNSAKYDKTYEIGSRVVYLQAETVDDLIKTYKASADEIDRLKLLAESVWQKIINLDFPDVSKYTPDINGVLQFEDDLLNGN